ncbi:kinase-like protein [Dothidotthia symphoricarpi CBS 119687]|uniref:Kinase-like protein n=1 Tax=Dothidotthia symphoricarpi CBS 119687 TaxID=1392245 RepID=A0A6A6AMX0_9PLEO|nr:kinase-like protein [Dothidotthia symphoricarpi CBS 119687]KAF2133279.1 kinase-like protein [Dothidotthia symphoricarpi CBS 119687]
MAAVTRIAGLSGRRYIIERVLQDKPGPLGRIYLASWQYVLKSVSKNDFKPFQDMFNDLRKCPYVRVADDALPDQSMFAYRYFKGHLLSFAQRDVSLPLTKKVLKDSLRGIAALHDKGIVHTDIKADNIMVDWNETGGSTTVTQVQIADIEDAAYVPNDCAIVGRQVGNWMWRSPEAHASGQVSKPSDVFSFGIVCIYALTRRVILAVGDEELQDGEDKLAIVLERQLSYFSDIDSLYGLLQHLGDSPWVQIFTVIAEGFNAEFPRAPFALWKDVDPEFKDLVGKMTSVDPKRRITAQEALAHRWFADVA